MMRLAVFSLVLLLAIASPSVGGASPSAPTTQGAPAPKIELGPMGALHVYNDTMLKGDKSLLKSRTHAVTEAGRKLQDACAANDAAVGRILKQVKSKIDDPSAHQISQLLGDADNEALADGTETIDGDHAEVSIRASAGKTQMIRIDGLWRIDYDKAAANFNQLGQGQLEQVLEMHKVQLLAAEALDKALSNDEVKNVDDAVRTIQMAYRRQMLGQ